MIESTLVHSDFTLNSSYTLVPIQSGDSELVDSLGSITSTPFTYTALISSNSGPIITWKILYFNISDQYFQTSLQSLSLSENCHVQLTPDLVCSSSGLKSIQYLLLNYGQNYFPTWIQVIADTGVLDVRSIDVTVDTDFYFYISSNINQNNILISKVIKLTVKNCIVSNCQKCSDFNSSICAIWNSDYTLISNSKSNYCRLNASKISIILSAISQIIAGLILLAIVFLSLINTSSIAVFWLIINQIQIFFSFYCWQELIFQKM